MTRIVIYTKENCSYCERAKAFFKSKNIQFEEVRVDLDEEKRREMEQLTQRRTVPQIFINQKHIGGYDDLIRLSQSGELSKLISTR